MANPEHSEKLNEGATAWNAWREANPDVAPDLSMVNLSLNRRQFGPSNGGPINLSHTNLEATMLRFATLTGANLEGACFAGSDLMHARLERTNLTNADLRGALLDNSDFTGSVLEGTLLYGASLLNVRNLFQHQIDQAYGDETTLLPEDLTLPQHWMATEEPELLVNEAEEAATVEEITAEETQPEIAELEAKPQPEPVMQTEAREVRDAIEKVLAELKSNETIETASAVTSSEDTSPIVAPELGSVETAKEDKPDIQAPSTVPPVAVLTLSKLDNSYSPPPIPFVVKPEVDTNKIDAEIVAREAETSQSDVSTTHEVEATDAARKVEEAPVVAETATDITKDEASEIAIRIDEVVAVDEEIRSDFASDLTAETKDDPAEKLDTQEPIKIEVPQYTPQLIAQDDTEPKQEATDDVSAFQIDVSRYTPQPISIDGEPKVQTTESGDENHVTEMVFRPEKYGTLHIPLDEPATDTSESDIKGSSDFLKEHIPLKITPIEEPKSTLSEDTYYNYTSSDYTSSNTTQAELPPFSPSLSSTRYEEPKPPFEIGNVYYEAAPKKKSNSYLGIAAVFVALLISGGAYYWLGSSDAEEPKQAAAIGENTGEKTTSPVPTVSETTAPSVAPAPVVTTGSTTETPVSPTPVMETPTQEASNKTDAPPTPATPVQPEQIAVTEQNTAPAEPPKEVEPPKENVTAVVPPVTPSVEQTTAQNDVQTTQPPVEQPQAVVAEPPVVEQQQTNVAPTPPTAPETQVLAANTRPENTEAAPTPPAEQTTPSPRAKAAEKEWKRVSHSKNLTAIYRFLKKYPNETISAEARATFGSVVSETDAPKLAKFAKKNTAQNDEEIALVKQRLAEIQPEAAVTPAPVRANTNAQAQAANENSSPEDAAWAKATKRNTRAGFEAYLRAHPEGAHATEAKSKVEGLRASYRQIDAAAWEKAQRAGTAEAYSAYLASHPRGYHVGDAKRAMSEARQEEPRASRPRRETQRSRETRQQREEKEHSEPTRRTRTRQTTSSQSPDNPEPMD